MTAVPRPLIWIGGAALFTAVATDAIAVVGRHVGVPLHGSIELVQAAVLVSGTVAMVVATLLHAHASVHVLVDRLSARQRSILGRINRIVAAIYVLMLLVGSVWIASDVWHGHEMSELLGVPFRPLRVLLALGLAAVALLFLRPATSKPGE